MKVAIVGSRGTCSYAKMFLKMGWEIVHVLAEADLVQFTGGEDVSPELYGAKKHPTTYNNPVRDEFEKLIFEQCIKLQVPMAGICRGGQFLNVMSGGAMWQDVDGHAIYGTHSAIDQDTGQVVEVTSTHHQMMRPSDGAKILALASESTFRENVFCLHAYFEDDVEACYYPNTNALCFQPHAEFAGADSTREYYFELIHRCLGLSA